MMLHGQYCRREYSATVDKPQCQGCEGSFSGNKARQLSSSEKSTVCHNGFSSDLGVNVIYLRPKEQHLGFTGGNVKGQGTVIVNEPRAFSYGQANARVKEAMKGSWKIDLVAASRRVPQGLEVEHKVY
jgi:hypothetical protein